MYFYSIKTSDRLDPTETFLISNENLSSEEFDSLVSKHSGKNPDKFNLGDLVLSLVKTGRFKFFSYKECFIVLSDLQGNNIVEPRTEDMDPGKFYENWEDIKSRKESLKKLSKIDDNKIGSKFISIPTRMGRLNRDIL